MTAAWLIVKHGRSPWLDFTLAPPSSFWLHCGLLQQRPWNLPVSTLTIPGLASISPTSPAEEPYARALCGLGSSLAAIGSTSQGLGVSLPFPELWASPRSAQNPKEYKRPRDRQKRKARQEGLRGVATRWKQNSKARRTGGEGWWLCLSHIRDQNGSHHLEAPTTSQRQT